MTLMIPTRKPSDYGWEPRQHFLTKEEWEQGDEWTRHPVGGYEYALANLESIKLMMKAEWMRSRLFNMNTISWLDHVYDMDKLQWLYQYAIDECKAWEVSLHTVLPKQV